MNERTPPPTAEFYRRLEAQDCRSQSVRYWPEQDPRTYEYTISAKDFLAGGVYLPRHASPGRNRLLPWYDPRANPITARELAENPGFVREVLDGWYQEELGPITQAELAVLHCSGCDRRIVADGVHRVLWIATQGSPDAALRVTELSGARWPKETPDFHVICACHGKNDARESYP